MYTVWQSKKKIYIDNLGWSCTIVKQQRHIYVPDTPKYVCTSRGDWGEN